MTESSSVLAHLVLRFSAHPENIATEALGYILRRSPRAREAFRKVLAPIGVKLSDDLTYITQVRDESGAQPDIAASRPDGTVQMLVEAKFWAGLTDNQPVGYLSILPAASSLLLFIAPALRIETLWAELCRRTASYGEVGANIDSSSTLRARQTAQHILAVISWSDLLSQFLTTAEAAGDASTTADVRQLLALCGRMDSGAFLPLTSEELTSTMGRRIVQFGELATDLVQALVGQGMATTKGLRTTVGNGKYGRYFLLRGHGALLCFNVNHWAKWGDSPLWLQVWDSRWRVSEEIFLTLERAKFKIQGRDEGAQIPIVLRHGVERSEVMSDCLKQLEAVANALPEVPETGVEPPGPDEVADSATSEAGEP